MNRAKALTQNFYSWEQRCRGWLFFDEAVRLEPPFEPFFHQIPGQNDPVVDDSFRPSLFTRLVSAFSNATTSETESDNEDVANDLKHVIAQPNEPLVAMSISLPDNYGVPREGMESLLLMLSETTHPISFEVIGNAHSIRLQFVCNETDEAVIYTQVKAYFPECGIQEVPVDDIFVSTERYQVVSYVLQEECMRPLSIPKQFNIDPLTGIFAALGTVRGDEQIALQILFTGAVYPWSESIIRSVSDGAGGSFFTDASEMVKLAQEKTALPLFAVVIRIIGCTNNDSMAAIETLDTAIRQATRSNVNSLMPLTLTDESALTDVWCRQSHQVGMLLNLKELATLVHLPSASVVAPQFKREVKKSKSAPAIFLGHTLVLGSNIHRGTELQVTINDYQRLKHTHIIGATGTGKSTLLLSSIIQDIANGEGIAVIDPHGDLIESVLSWVHPDRHQDVIVIDPADADYPVGLNILTAHSEIEKDILSSDLVAAFRRLSTSWGDQMNSVFANAILAFLESTRGGTLMDLRRFLIEKSFRDEFLLTVSDPSIIYYWRQEFPIIKSASIGPILTRLDSFLRPKVIRNMVAQNKSLDFEQILDAKKILLIKLSQGLIGTENSYLLGTFLVSKIQQAAMARQAKAKADRSNYYVYIDEFQNFITPSMSAILSGARKYHLGLILVHQDMQQLIKQDAELASAVVTNAGTRICFRLGDTDAKRFADGFSSFDSTDLQNLDTGEAIIRVERPENDCNIVTVPIEELESDVTEYNRNMVIARSRHTFGTPREEVEKALQTINTRYADVEQRETPIIKSPKAETPKPQSITTEVAKSTQPVTFPKPETQHRYLQNLIKKMAESRGYVARLEEPTLDGQGKVDVSLARNNKRIAVEINDTSKDAWELHNIEKCLASGYDIVVACSTDANAKTRMRQKISEKFRPEVADKILALNPDDLILYLDSEIAKEASSEIRIKGYRVKVDYEAVSEQEMNKKREAIAKSVIDADPRRN